MGTIRHFFQGRKIFRFNKSFPLRNFIYSKSLKISDIRDLFKFFFKDSVSGNVKFQKIFKTALP
ncbi:hypothetical protein SAMN06265219_11967 [Gracilimonas mengyeensis]|uniref:Uncharacterized protein n=1 Tax=Gracilimonas mengyeensis TaxID=1302730 RepID=A0A521FIT4_9BACT|nr:hypothetical protein SAMN06265219_11967 [Gracilimonas mengyeensis]